MRLKLEGERRALAAFVSKFDSLGLGMSFQQSKLNPPMPTAGGATAAFAERQINRTHSIPSTLSVIDDCSPVKMKAIGGQPSLLEQVPEDGFLEDVSFEVEVGSKVGPGKDFGRTPLEDVFLNDKENVPA